MLVSVIGGGGSDRYMVVVTLVFYQFQIKAAYIKILTLGFGLEPILELIPLTVRWDNCDWLSFSWEPIPGQLLLREVESVKRWHLLFELYGRKVIVEGEQFPKRIVESQENRRSARKNSCFYSDLTKMSCGGI